MLDKQLAVLILDRTDWISTVPELVDRVGYKLLKTAQGEPIWTSPKAFIERKNQQHEPGLLILGTEKPTLLTGDLERVRRSLPRMQVLCLLWDDQDHPPRGVLKAGEILIWGGSHASGKARMIERLHDFRWTVPFPYKVHVDQVVDEPFLLGESSAISTLRGAIQQVRQSPPHVVLIRGESGAGKEAVAKEIARGCILRMVNMPEISKDLLASELFGTREGAFTGAVDRPGLILSAASLAMQPGGYRYIFLDEIGEMRLPDQAKLLRVIENRRVRRVGADEEEDTRDLRFILATNRDLERMVADRRFREDLYWRISTWPLHVPPLRDHSDDIPTLVLHFLHELCTERGRSPPELLADSLNCLREHTWPGNVRQLRNFLQQALGRLHDARVWSRDSLDPLIRESDKRRAQLTIMGPTKTHEPGAVEAEYNVFPQPVPARHEISALMNTSCAVHHCRHDARRHSSYSLLNALYGNHTEESRDIKDSFCSYVQSLCEAARLPVRPDTFDNEQQWRQLIEHIHQRPFSECAWAVFRIMDKLGDRAWQLQYLSAWILSSMGDRAKADTIALAAWTGDDIPGVTREDWPSLRQIAGHLQQTTQGQAVQMRSRLLTVLANEVFARLFPCPHLLAAHRLICAFCWQSGASNYISLRHILRVLWPKAMSSLGLESDHVAGEIPTLAAAEDNQS